MVDHGPFNEGDKAIIREIAWQVGDAVSERLKNQFDNQMKSRCDACVIAKKVDRAAMAVKTTWVILGGVIAAIMYLINMFLTYFKK